MRQSIKLVHCNTCGCALKSGDPVRKYQVASGEFKLTWSGECAQCSSDRIVKNKWMKRSSEDIKVQLERNHNNSKILISILNERVE